MGVIEWVRLAFSDNGQPSSSRVLTAASTLASIASLLFVVWKTHAMPDGMALTGLGAFASSPYAVNRASKMFGKDKDKDADTTVVVKTNL
ncbi:Uncharacterised protein [uncultured archaeon]|nr:Uncharacterised protein [uncultured archaeon]